VVGAGADELGLAVGGDDEGGGIGLVAFAAGRLPADAAGGGVEGDDELGIEAVATDDEEVFKEGGGAAGAVLGFVAEDLLPEDFAFGVQAGGAEEAVVDVEAVALDDDGGRGVAIFGVDAGSGAGGAEDFGIEGDFAGGRCRGRGGGGRYSCPWPWSGTSLAAGDGGAGPARAGEGRFPADVFGVGPGGGETLFDGGGPGRRGRGTVASLRRRGVRRGGG
jgi:hypothetical protein